MKQKPARKRAAHTAKRRSASARRAQRSVKRPARAPRRIVATRRPQRPSPTAEESLPPQRPIFSKSELRQFRQLLLTQKTNLAGGIQQIAKGASKSQRDTAGDISTYTYHMADVASDTYDRELSLNIASTEQKVLYQIEEALKRVEDGSYGRCFDCSKPVPQTRLRAVPYAALCIGCQRLREDRRSR